MDINENEYGNYYYNEMERIITITVAITIIIIIVVACQSHMVN